MVWVKDIPFQSSINDDNFGQVRFNIKSTTVRYNKKNLVLNACYKCKCFIYGTTTIKQQDFMIIKALHR